MKVWRGQILNALDILMCHVSTSFTTTDTKKLQLCRFLGMDEDGARSKHFPINSKLLTFSCPFKIQKCGEAACVMNNPTENASVEDAASRAIGVANQRQYRSHKALIAEHHFFQNILWFPQKPVKAGVPFCFWTLRAGFAFVFRK